MAVTRVAYGVDDLRAALRVRELSDAARVHLSERMGEAHLRSGVLRDLEVWTLYEVRTPTVTKEMSRSRWEKLRGLAEVRGPDELVLPARTSWEATSVQGRAPGEPRVVTCGACHGRRPTRCLSCRGVGRVSCGCSRQSRAMCAACRGTGRKPCIACGRSGFLGCAVCAGAGELHAVELCAAERGVERLRVAVERAPEGFELPDDDEVSDAWGTEHEERAERLSHEAPSLDAERPLSYRGSYARELDAATDEALRAALAGFAPKAPGAEVCAQRLVVRSLPYACARWPRHGYALWLLGERGAVLEQGPAPRARRRRGGLVALSTAASLGAAVAWWLAGR